MSPAPVPLPGFGIDDVPAIPDRAQPDQLATLLGMARAEARAHAEIEATHGRSASARAWAAYAAHLIDVVAGYEQAIANVTAPPSNGTDTSDAAARTIKPGVTALRARILRHLSRPGPGPFGCTVRDLERALDMSHGTASARVHEMARLGYIVDTGRRGVTATTPDGRNFTGAVYDITTAGRNALAQYEATTKENTPCAI